MSHCCMMDWRMMFGKILLFVGLEWAPVNEEVPLVCLILDPIESHIHCFGFIMFESVVDDA